MTREYKLETTRNGETAELYIHNDDTLEFSDPESSVPTDYLSIRLTVVKQLVELGRKYGLTHFEMNIVP